MKSSLCPCGTDCEHCEWFKGNKEQQCTGCSSVEGNPFWGSCNVFKCVKEKNVNHCGECKEFPCDLFMNQYDPDEGRLYCVIRAGLLAYRAQQGDEKAKELTKETRSLWNELRENARAQTM